MSGELEFPLHKPGKTANIILAVLLCILCVTVPAAVWLLTRLGKAKAIVRADGFRVDSEIYIELEGSTPATMATATTIHPTGTMLCAGQADGPRNAHTLTTSASSPANSREKDGPRDGL